MPHLHHQRLKLQFLQRLWQVARPYWTSSKKRGAWGLLLLLLLLSIISAGLLVIVSIFLGDVTSALAAQDGDRFRQSIITFIGVIVIGVPLLSLKLFIQAQLSLYWRRWLTQETLWQYFSDRQFYKLTQRQTPPDAGSLDAGSPDIDNPDQRIAEDINTFTEQALFFLIAFLDSCLQLLFFIGVLWAISKPLMAFLVIYAVGGTFITGIVFGRKLIFLNMEQLKREANFRFGLVRVRENAEAIALYDGQHKELVILQQRFQSLFDNFNHLIRWQLGLNFFQNGYQYLTFLLPALILARPILNGTMEVGVQSQAVIAFRSILLALAVIIQQFEKLAEFMARGDRLYDFGNIMTSPARPVSPYVLRTGSAKTKGGLRGVNSNAEITPPQPSPYKGEGADPPVSSLSVRRACSENVEGLRGVNSEETRGVIQVIEAPHITLDHLTLYTPDRSTKIISDLSLTVEPGRSLLIQGPSGVGKSSLLRAIAGLWDTGRGIIKRPPLEQLIFLPQRPYMALGTLRQQLIYPLNASVLDKKDQLDDEQFQHILEQVNLPLLVKQHGGWETIKDWSQVLSVGEQQRLAIARLLLAQSLPSSQHFSSVSGVPERSLTQRPPLIYAILDEATSALDPDNENRLYQLLNQQSITCLSVGHRASLQIHHHEVLDLSQA